MNNTTRTKLSYEIVNQVNKVLEDVDCSYNKDKKVFEFTVEQLNKFHKNITEAVIIAYRKMGVE